MLDRSVLKQKIQEYTNSLIELEEVLKPQSLNERISELSKASEDASFWSDQKKARTVISELNDLKDKVSSFNNLKENIETLNLLFEMSLEDEEALNEAQDLFSSFNRDFEELSNEILLGEKEDRLNAIMEIHSGAGGTESLDWVEMLYRMYQMYASSHKMKVTVLDFEAGDETGIKDVVIKISGKYAYGNLKSESGVHRLVRLSPFDSSHSRHTTFASVLVTPELTEDIDIVLKDEDLRIDIFHSSGAGGQGVNTSFSAVRITHLPTNTVVTCQNERSQIQNKATALAVLKSRLYQMEMDRLKEEKDKLLNKPQISFGSQIRSYVFHPYTLVKDHRTGYETSQGNRVMDGEIDQFISEYLKNRGKENSDG